MLKDIVDFANSQNFEVTRLMVRSVDMDSQDELIEFVLIVYDGEELVVLISGLLKLELLSIITSQTVADGTDDQAKLTGWVPVTDL